VSLGLLHAQGQSLILAGALLSITINPLVCTAIEPVQRWVRSRSHLARALERRDDPLAELPATVDAASLSGHVALVGYGRVGTRIAPALGERGIAYVVAEQNRELVERLRERGAHAVSGDAAEAELLRKENLGKVFMGEHELALAMSRETLSRYDSLEPTART
jgi:CPA2 family monovalent cation:H+ antiporter-2